MKQIKQNHIRGTALQHVGGYLSSMFVVTLLIVQILITAGGFATVDAKEEKKEFDVNKLIEYNSLATCIAQIHQDFSTCNTKGAEKANSAIGQLDLGEEFGKRLKCCGMWKLRDCWMKSARVKCTKEQADQIYGLPQLFMPALASECHEYTPESGKCTVPLWLITAVGSGALFILVLAIFGCFVCFKKFRYCRKQINLESPEHKMDPAAHPLKANHQLSLSNGNSKLKSNGISPQSNDTYSTTDQSQTKPITNGNGTNGHHLISKQSGDSGDNV